MLFAGEFREDILWLAYFFFIVWAGAEKTLIFLRKMVDRDNPLMLL